MLDVSASQQVGEIKRLKIDIAKEICGVLTLSAIQEASKGRFAVFFGSE
jgi:hypothetical protein